MQTLTPLRVVTSFDGRHWDGAAPNFGSTDPEAKLEQVFRYFNRVEDADCQRLEDIGYQLPSLSGDDLVRIDEDWYLCASVGWTPLSSRQATRYWGRILEAAERDESKPIVNGLDDDMSLLIVTHRGEERIDRSGLATVVRTREEWAADIQRQLAERKAAREAAS